MLFKFIVKFINLFEILVFHSHFAESKSVKSRAMMISDSSSDGVI